MKPGLKTLIIGITLFLLGGFVIPVLLILPIFLTKSSEQQFLIPGTKELTIEEPSRYYLWNDCQTVFEGKSYSRSERLPDGIEITVTDGTGKILAFQSDTSISSSSGSSSKNSIGYVEVSEPSELFITVKSASEKRVFSFSESIFSKVFLPILGGGMASMLMAFVGFGLGVWGVVKLLRNKSGEQVSSGNAACGGTNAELQATRHSA